MVKAGSHQLNKCMEELLDVILGDEVLDTVESAVAFVVAVTSFVISCCKVRCSFTFFATSGVSLSHRVSNNSICLHSLPY